MLDVNCSVSSDAFSSAHHVGYLFGAQPEVSGRMGAVPLSCQKTAFLTRQAVAASGCVRLVLVNRLDMDAVGPLGLGPCFAMLVYF